MSLSQAREALGELTRTCLLTQHTPGRFAFHDLLRAYAAHIATTHDPLDDQHAALTRLFDHYLHTAAAAMDTLQPADQHQHPRPRMPPPAIPVADPHTAQHWLNTERANLAAIITHTAAHGWHTHTTQLANTVLPHYEIGVHYPHALALYTHVQHAAHHIDDQATEAQILNGLGEAHHANGQLDQARTQHTAALTLATEIGDRYEQAHAHHGLAHTHHATGNLDQAHHHRRQALALYTDLNVPTPTTSLDRSEMPEIIQPSAR
jgi:tetratricopeptide (TPR) repeat protein